jgi:trans-aconitate 2-methyltransferase
VAEPRDYWRMLEPLGAGIDIWECEYLQPLAGEDAVLQWVTGTSLRPLISALSEDWRNAFVADFAARLREAYPRESDGTTLFPFKRLFILASRPRSS